MTQYYVPQRGVREAVAIANLRDRFTVEVLSDKAFRPDRVWLVARERTSRRCKVLRKARAA